MRTHQIPKAAVTMICVGLCQGSLNAAGPIIRHQAQASGHASFITGVNPNAAIDTAIIPGDDQVTPMAFLQQHGRLMGISNADAQLRFSKSSEDQLGQTHTTYQQMHQGVPVFSGIVKVHQRADGNVIAANGFFRTIPAKTNMTPLLDALQGALAAKSSIDQLEAETESIELVVVDPGWYGDAFIGARLAWHVVIRDLAVPMRDAFFVDARSGEILDRWSVMYTARFREVYDAMQTADLPGTLVRSEGDPPAGAPDDADPAYDFAGDTYDYLWRAFGRDSIDDLGLAVVLTVDSTAMNCPNARWNGSQSLYCTGAVTDDVTAHEIAHGLTQYTADLIYQNQSGQLNESYSDIIGELVDLFNGDVAFVGPPAGPNWPATGTGPGSDVPNNARSSCSFAPDYTDGYRWLVGEDASAFGGSIRDMWDPPCEGHPDRGNSTLQTCPGGDNGGVHSGSGVPNHAFAMLVDGKSFNGQSVTAIGPIKAGAIWYRALTTYLSVASDFEDAFVAINQSALDLVGTDPNDPRTGLPSGNPITSFDAEQVNLALMAVEMNSEGSCGATVPVLSPEVPVECGMQDVFYSDDFESGASGWTVSIIGAPQTPYDWVLSSNLPQQEPGTAWYCLDFNDGCPSGGEESAVHVLTSPVINIPDQLSFTTLKFKHYASTEPLWDGGNVKISVNAGPFELIPNSAFTFNAYNATLNEGSNTNPIAGQPAFSGVGGGWGVSLVRLAGLVNDGDTIQIAFEFGKDFCNGVDGWYIDDVQLYNCTCITNADCDDGVFCNGEETCSDGLCSVTPSPCGAGYCDEGAEECPATAFWDDFENDNASGWDFYAPGSTASTGNWEIGDPVGTTEGGSQAQPELAFEGLACAFTAQNSSLGNADVDGGVVYLESPAIDLSGQDEAVLRFTRWFYQRDIDDDPGDFYSTEVSSNGGSDWVQLELIGDDASANNWTTIDFNLHESISLTSDFKVRFGVSDGADTGDIIEGAIDNVVVILPQVLSCSAPVVTSVSSRRVAVTPAPGAEPIALRIGGSAGDPSVACLSKYVQADGTLGDSPVFQLPDVWGIVMVRGGDIVPGVTYEFQSECQAGGALSVPIPGDTWPWGDVEPNGVVNFADVLLVAQAFQQDYSNVTLEAADLDPCDPNELVNFTDIFRDVQAFQGQPYATTDCPVPCK